MDLPVTPQSPSRTSLSRKRVKLSLPFARRNKPAHRSARSEFRFRKLSARERQDQQPAKRPAASTQSARPDNPTDRKSTRLNSSHVAISYAVFCLKKKKK